MNTSCDEKRKTFVFYVSWWEALSKFPLEMHFAILNAVMTYVSTGVVPEIEDDAVRIGFELIREDIDMAQEKYDAKRQSRSRAAQKRRAKAKENNPEESQAQTSKESTTSTTSTTIMSAEEMSAEEMPEEDVSDEEEMSAEEMSDEEMSAEEMSAEESSDDEAESPSSGIVATYGRQPFEPLTSPYVVAGSASKASRTSKSGSASKASKTSKNGSASRTSECEIRGNRGNRGNPGRCMDAIKIDYGDYGTPFAV